MSMSSGHQDGNMMINNFNHLIDDMEIFFQELDYLRESATMNMFGAPRWLQDNYDLSKEEAKHVFVRWTKTIEA